MRPDTPVRVDEEEERVPTTLRVPVVVLLRRTCPAVPCPFCTALLRRTVCPPFTVLDEEVRRVEEMPFRLE